MKALRLTSDDFEKILKEAVRSLKKGNVLACPTDTVHGFIGKVWPGKVTVILASRSKLPKELGTAKTIGLRIPKYRFLNLLLEAYGKPLTGTSANLSGTPSLSDSKEIIAQFQNRKHKPDTVLDAGVLPKSKPSKIIDITGVKHIILRK